MKELKTNSYLLVDAGNTCIKFLVRHGKTEKIFRVKTAREFCDKLKSFKKQQFDQALFSSVLSTEETRRLFSCGSYVSGKTVSVKQASGNIIKTSYDFRKLGEDRLAALCYAVRSGIAPCVIIDAGTAVTVDFLARPNIFLGGFILSGFQTELNMLHEMTHNLPVFKILRRQRNVFPCSTKEAMNSGVIRVKSLGIRELIGDTLKEKGLDRDKWNIVLGGGDAGILKNFIPSGIMIKELVIEGLRSLL